jgi:hypothetical protein
VTTTSVTGTTDTRELAPASCGATNRAYKNPCDLDPGHFGEHHNIEGDSWHNYGPVDLYEITWMTGHIETVQAHQVTYPHAGLAMPSLGGSLGLATETGPPRIHMHAEIGGRWTLTLQAREEDIRTIRLVTGGEQIPGGAR